VVAAASAALKAILSLEPATLSCARFSTHQREMPDFSKNQVTDLMRHYETGSERLFSDVVLDAKLQDFDLANALLLGFDLSCLCTEQEKQVVWQFLEALDETKPAWMNFVGSRFGDGAEETAQARLTAFKKGFEIENKRPQTG
jgi:predicted nucleotidyltransferase